MTVAAGLLQELEQESQATRRVLERVPDSRLAWRPHEKSWTLGELAMHIAMVPGGVAEFVARPSPVQAPGRRRLLFELLEQGVGDRRHRSCDHGYASTR